MSMYLPNDDVEPTGEEAAEFLVEPETDEEADARRDAGARAHGDPGAEGAGDET